MKGNKMSNICANISKGIRHNQGEFVAILICLGLLVFSYGCQSRVESLIKPERLVTRAELMLELEAEQARLAGELTMLTKSAEAKFAELDRKEEIKSLLLNFGMVASETGQVNPAGIIGLLVSILGVGAIVDNRIKDKVIKNRPLKP